LSKAATGADLSAEQLTKLIDSLSKRQEEILGSSATANGKGGKNARHDFFSCYCCRQDCDFTVSTTFYSDLCLVKLLEIENGFLVSRRTSQHTHPQHVTCTSPLQSHISLTRPLSSSPCPLGGPCIEELYKGSQETCH